MRRLQMVEEFQKNSTSCISRVRRNIIKKNLNIVFVITGIIIIIFVDRSIMNNVTNKKTPNVYKSC